MRRKELLVFFGVEWRSSSSSNNQRVLSFSSAFHPQRILTCWSLFSLDDVYSNGKDWAEENRSSSARWNCVGRMWNCPAEDPSMVLSHWTDDYENCPRLAKVTGQDRREYHLNSPRTPTCCVAERMSCVDVVLTKLSIVHWSTRWTSYDRFSLPVENRWTWGERKSVSKEDQSQLKVLLGGRWRELLFHAGVDENDNDELLTGACDCRRHCLSV